MEAECIFYKSCTVFHSVGKKTPCQLENVDVTNSEGGEIHGIGGGEEDVRRRAEGKKNGARAKREAKRCRRCVS
jgi:hypothetical protein